MKGGLIFALVLFFLNVFFVGGATVHRTLENRFNDYKKRGQTSFLDDEIVHEGGERSVRSADQKEGDVFGQLNKFLLLNPSDAASRNTSQLSEDYKY
jgi:hypothetical protein